eukprot:Ihof_evm4s395 gene=Ihof_evmTU4s395
MGRNVSYTKASPLSPPSAINFSLNSVKEISLRQWRRMWQICQVTTVITKCPYGK